MLEVGTQKVPVLPENISIISKPSRKDLTYQALSPIRHVATEFVTKESTTAAVPNLFCKYNPNSLEVCDEYAGKIEVIYMAEVQVSSRFSL